MNSTNKRYYWLKLKEDFFDDDTISWLEEQPNGKEYALFYLKLCLKSLKTEGTLIRVVGNMIVPYDVKKIAEITRTDFDTAVVAMELLKKIGLIQILEDGSYFVTELQNMVGSETGKAELMRKKRARDKMLPQPSNNVTDNEENCYTENRDKSTENRDKSTENRDKKNVYQQIADMYNAICKSYPKVKRLSDSRKRALHARLNTYSMDDFKELFTIAEENSFLKGQNRSNWTATFDWLIKDANMAKVLDGNYNNSGTHTSGNSSAGSQRNYSTETYDLPDIELPDIDDPFKTRQ